MGSVVLKLYMLAESEIMLIYICKISTKENFAEAYFIFVNLFFLSIDLLSFLRNYVNSTSTWGRALCQTEHSVAKAWMMDPFT
jgi:hypothetical protein